MGLGSSKTLFQSRLFRRESAYIHTYIHTAVNLVLLFIYRLFAVWKELTIDSSPTTCVFRSIFSSVCVRLGDAVQGSCCLLPCFVYCVQAGRINKHQQQFDFFSTLLFVSFCFSFFFYFCLHFEIDRRCESFSPIFFPSRRQQFCLTGRGL